MMLALFADVIFNFMSELLIGILIFMGRLPRRKNFMLRAVAGFLAVDIVAYALNQWLVFPNLILNSITYLFCFVILGIPYVLLCYKVTIWDAVFSAICGYATQHFASSLHILVQICLLNSTGDVWLTLDYIPVYILSYLLFYLLFARHLQENGRFVVDTKQALDAVLTILPVVLFLSIVAKYIVVTEGSSSLFVLCQIYAMVCCFYMLLIQVNQQKLLRLQREMALKESIWQQQRQQYANSKSNIDLINRKCHDLKHQMAALRTTDTQQREAYLRELEDAVLFYDAEIKTGNEALDTVLTEKSLFCRQHDIHLACVADGDCVKLLDTVDIYTIFGNALDNAIECVSKLQDSEKRYISLKIFRQASFLMMQVENFCETQPELVDGLPVSSKEPDGYHGFGLRSILLTAEKYDGCVTIHWKNGMFHLQILVPLPEATD
ncbi:MAG: ATP-binding protein [Clostridiales bacterium]|nr:ATP-binding protein [Clostridiales bacterium]